MTAILLAAGVGKRMGGTRPKCLHPVGGRSLLQRLLESLRAAGVHHVVLVVGHAAAEVAADARRHARDLRLTIVENPRYQEGAILSLWAAREMFADDLLIMDADVLCPPVFLERLVRSPHRNALLVDGTAVDSGEEQIVLGQASRAWSIAKRPSPELRERWRPMGESVGFLKLSQPAAARLRQLLDARVSVGETGIEHEQVYPDLFQDVPVGIERVDGLAWIEVDTPDDLRRAVQEILPRWTPPGCVTRQMAQWSLPWVLRLPVTPNQWTTISCGFGLAALAAIARGGYGWGVAGAVLFQACYVVDNWDGEVARAKGMSSVWGGWYDVVTDAVIQTMLPLAFAVELHRRGMPAWIMTVGGIAAAGMALGYAVTLWAKQRGFGPAIYGDPSRGQVVAGDSGLRRRLRANLTHENFSLLIATVLLVDLRLAFLLAMAVGSQVFWVQFLWRNRYSLAQARR